MRDSYRGVAARPENTGLGFSMLHGREFSNRLQGWELPTFTDLLESADLVVDVGANVGYFSIIAARAGVPVLAVEPGELNLEALRTNVARYSLVEVCEAAVSDRAGSVPLYGSGQGASVQRGWGGMESTYSSTVMAVTLDALLADRGGRLLVKIDVEGHENAVLAGARATLARSPRPVLLVEHGPIVSGDYVGFFETLWAAGYTVVALPEARRRQPYVVEASTVSQWAELPIAPELMFLAR